MPKTCRGDGLSEDGDRDWSDAAMSQGMQRKQLKGARKSVLKISEGTWSSQHLDF
jgi:hypothetical protein